jgi:biofilm PGA synthesis lipoprotein PgaB
MSRGVGRCQDFAARHPFHRIARRIPVLLLLLIVSGTSMSLFSIDSAGQIPRSEAGPIRRPPGVDADPPQSFRVLCYHDIRDNLRDSFKRWPEGTALDTQDLIRHFSWLKENGYHPVSLQEIVNAREGRASLPEKAVLLTFDDGYKSVYTKVFPLLKQFDFPAVIAIVGDWIETPPDVQVEYGDGVMARSEFVTWDEVREMIDSGLIEVASHSHSMHHGVRANPQGSKIPAAISRYYWPQHGGYETDNEYAERIKSDLKRSADLIAREAGVRPRAMVWPYGAYSLVTARWAAEAGMPITMNLEPGPNTPDDSLLRVRRALIMYHDDLRGLIQILRQPASYAGTERPRERAVQIDLDEVYDPDSERQEANLSRLLDRMLRLQPSAVYLRPFADPDHDGVADAAYFPNRHLPMRTDLFSRVAWQFKTRLEIPVYAVVPVMAFRLPPADAAAVRTVQVMPGAPQAAGQRRRHRLSLFDPATRKTVTEIYEDLGKNAVIAGLLFDDDATLSDYEDASPAALRFYREQWQLPESVEAIRRDPVLRRRWMEKKSAYLNEFTLSLANTMRQYHPALLTARILHARPILEPESEEWLAQSLQGFLATYDFTVVSAMPYTEDPDDPAQWLGQLLGKVKATPGALPKTIFRLQSRDWRTGKPIPSKALAAQLRQLHLGGASNFGYYPDDFRANQPDESVVKPVISVESHPARR